MDSRHDRQVYSARLLIIALSITLLTMSGSGLACNWDTETLLQERSRFPTVLELIVGKFPRHTPEYYEWRLQDRLMKLKSSPEDDLLLDDIAVSYEKLERYQEAIDVATKQLERNPNRYESLANLGTFLIHNGQWSEGLVFIEKAIAVNPEAHFGRERYQLILVKYVISRSKNGSLELPLARERFANRERSYHLPFYAFLKDEWDDGETEGAAKVDIDKAVTGVLGMMRFSRHDSPILLEVLGELQEARSARQLAYRAYQSAAQHVEDPQSKQRYEQLASHVLEWSLESWNQINHVEIKEAEIASDFRKEQADADAWFAQLVNDERHWIASGEAVDEKFNEKYRELPEAIVTDRETEPTSSGDESDGDQHLLIGPLFLVGLLSAMIMATLYLFWERHRGATASPNG